MIRFKEQPPKLPSDVELTDSGIAIIKGAARPKMVTSLFHERLESPAEVAPRLALLGLAVRSTIEDGMNEDDRGTLFSQEIAANVVEQLRTALADGSSSLNEDDRQIARDFGVGLSGYTFDANLVGVLS